ncbi:MAG: DUF3786 domain-containing protein [Proteobacteria bacterium]|nr:DUF3786 domain-containing protein [Pseudomonadota bacterium]
MKPAPFQILKLLGSTNCKECGFESCLAFATYIYAYGPKALDKCPQLSEEIRNQIKSLFGEEENQSPTSMIEMWESFRTKLKELPRKEISKIDGITLDEKGDLIFLSLGEKILVSQEDIINENEVLTEHDKILFYYYLLNAHKLTGKYDFCDYRNFYSKLKVRDVKQEEFEIKLQDRVGNELDKLKKSLIVLGGEVFEDFKDVYDLSIILHIFPKVPLLILYRKGEEEFEPYCKFMFDKGCGVCFDSEGIEHLADYVVDKILKNL